MNGLNKSILIGTKEEIILFINNKFKSLNIEYINYEKNLEKEKLAKEKVEQEKNDLSNDLKIKESLNSELHLKIKELENKNNILIMEKEILLNNYKKEQNENKSLNDKLDNISSEINKNIGKVLKQLENEQKLKENLNLKYNNIYEDKKQNEEENKKLQEIVTKKEIYIKDLSNNNKNLEEEIKNLKKDLYLKEEKIQKIISSLNKENKEKQNIFNELQSEKNKNKNLTNKLDNISNENNIIVNKVLVQLENEQEKNKELKKKYSNLEKEENYKKEKNEELEKNLKEKDEELKKFKNNAAFQNGIKFEADCKEGEYDIIININSFQKLIKEGWSVKYNNKGKDTYLKKKDKNTIVVGVIGNGNKGKSFLLEKLLKGKIPKGFNVKTEGLSLKYGTIEDHYVAFLDSAGQERPLLKRDEKKAKIIK